MISTQLPPPPPSNATFVPIIDAPHHHVEQGTRRDTFAHSLPRSQRGADTRFETSTRKGHFRVGKTDRETLEKMPVNTLLLRYFDERSRNETAPGKHGLIAQALAVWERRGRKDDAARLRGLLPQLQEFFKHYWNLLRAAIAREPSLRAPLLNEGRALSDHALSLLLDGKKPMDACLDVTSETLLDQARRAGEQARMTEFHQQQRAFYRQPGHVMGSSLNSTLQEMRDLEAGHVNLIAGPANTLNELRQLPAGRTSGPPAAPVDRERVNAPGDVLTYQTAIYPRMDWPANLQTISVYGKDGLAYQVQLIRVGNELRFSRDLGATWEHLGTTSDEMEAIKQRNYLRFMREFTKNYIARRANIGSGSGHFLRRRDAGDGPVPVNGTVAVR